jgi:hypothetical protein
MQLKSGFTGVKTEKKGDGTRAGTDFGFSPAAVTGLIWWYLWTAIGQV